MAVHRWHETPIEGPPFVDVETHLAWTKLIAEVGLSCVMEALQMQGFWTAVDEPGLVVLVRGESKFTFRFEVEPESEGGSET